MASTDINWPLETAKIAAPFIAAWLAYFFAVRKMVKENPQAIQRKKYEAILAANQRAWSLIAYMTETENECSIVTWVKKGQERTYTFHTTNAQKFMNSLRVVFYDDGHGIFLSREVTDAVFEYRGLIYGLLHAYPTLPDTFVIEKQAQVRRLYELADAMRKAIRDSSEVKKRNLNLGTE